MKKFFIVLALFSLNTFSQDIKPLKTVYQIEEKLGELREDKFFLTLKDFLKASRPNRLPGSLGHIASEKFIETYLSENTSGGITTQEFLPDIDSAISVYKKDFDEKVRANYSENSDEYKNWNNFTLNAIDFLNKFRMIKGKNIIWEKKGFLSPNEVLILGAHYDTALNDFSTDTEMPGADNNASGVAVLLNMVKILNSIPIPKTIRIIFFDYEELQGLGVKNYILKLKDEKDLKYLGHLNLAMLGNDTISNDKEKKHGNMKVYLKKDNSSSLSFAQDLIDRGSKFSSIKFDILANSSEATSYHLFESKNINSILFSQNWESDYNLKGHHTKDDILEAVNRKTLYGSFQFITGAVISYLYGFKK